MTWFRELPLDWSRPETRAAEQVILEAYRLPSELFALAQNAGVNTATLNLMAPSLKVLVRDLFDKARAANRLLRLLAEVTNDPDREAFGRRLATLVAGHEAELAAAILEHRPSIALLASVPPSGEFREANKLAIPLAGFEKLINRASGFTDIVGFRKGLAIAEARAARISVGGRPQGTGFLVGESLLLTNWHVVAGIKNGLTGAAQFDHKREAGFTSDGRTVKFAASWLEAKSEHAAFIDEASTDGPSGAFWDYALVRLAEAIGAQPLGEGGSEKRGHFTLDRARYGFDANEPLLIVGHPDARPMQLSYASPAGARATKHATRIRYQTNTEPGSSGSPVFNKEWRLIVLHHASGPTSAPGPLDIASGEFNQGIQIADVVVDLVTKLNANVKAELGLE